MDANYLGYQYADSLGLADNACGVEDPAQYRTFNTSLAFLLGAKFKPTDSVFLDLFATIGSMLPLSYSNQGPGGFPHNDKVLLERRELQAGVVVGTYLGQGSPGQVKAFYNDE
jgi:hypothetical protein